MLHFFAAEQRELFLHAAACMRVPLCAMPLLCTPSRPGTTGHCARSGTRIEAPRRSCRCSRLFGAPFSRPACRLEPRTLCGPRPPRCCLLTGAELLVHGEEHGRPESHSVFRRGARRVQQCRRDTRQEGHSDPSCSINQAAAPLAVLASWYKTPPPETEQVEMAASNFDILGASGAGPRVCRPVPRARQDHA